MNSQGPGNPTDPSAKIKVEVSLKDLSKPERLYYGIFGRTYDVYVPMEIEGKEYPGVTYEFEVDDEGNIDLDGGKTKRTEMSFGKQSLRSISRFMRAGGLIKFVRNSRLFKNASLKNYLSQYYRQKAKIGNRSAADALIHEARTGQLLSPRGHYEK